MKRLRQILQEQGKGRRRGEGRRMFWKGMEEGRWEMALLMHINPLNTLFLNLQLVGG